MVILTRKFNEDIIYNVYRSLQSDSMAQLDRMFDSVRSWHSTQTKILRERSCSGREQVQRLAKWQASMSWTRLVITMILWKLS